MYDLLTIPTCLQDNTWTYVHDPRGWSTVLHIHSGECLHVKEEPNGTWAIYSSNQYLASTDTEQKAQMIAQTLISERIC